MRQNEPEELHYYIRQMSNQEIQRSLVSTFYKPSCLCLYCSKSQEPLIPSLTLNEEITAITSLHSSISPEQEQDHLFTLLNWLTLCGSKMPNLPIMDTVLFRGGDPTFMVKYSRGLKIDKEECRKFRTALLEKKKDIDI